MHPSALRLSLETAFDGFTLVSFGDLPVPQRPLRCGFQVDVLPSENPFRQVAVALVSHNVGGRADAESCTGFAVRVDLETGEIWDVLNNSGLIGWLEQPMSSFTDEEPLLISWEVQNHGAALIPNLRIGNETFLYPALLYTPGMIMATVAGSEAGADGDAITFLHPAAWRESV